VVLKLSVAVVTVIVGVITASVAMVLTEVGTCRTIINIMGTHNMVRS